MTHLSLFSGVGGIDIAAHWAGFETVAFVEREPFCQKVLAKNFPGVPIHDDVTQFDGTDLHLANLWHNRWEEYEAMKLNPKYADAPSRYAELKSIDAVAKEYGVTRQAMYKILKLRGTQFEPRARYGQDNVFYRGGSSAKDEAQNKMEQALIRGDLLRPDTCQRCQQKPKPFRDGRTAIQGHHYDYDKPLDVIWVCQKCHHQIHREDYLSRVQGVPASEASATKIDLISAGFP